MSLRFEMGGIDVKKVYRFFQKDLHDDYMHGKINSSSVKRTADTGSYLLDVSVPS